MKPETPDIEFMDEEEAEELWLQIKAQKKPTP